MQNQLTKNSYATLSEAEAFLKENKRRTDARRVWFAEYVKAHGVADAAAEQLLWSGFNEGVKYATSDR